MKRFLLTLLAVLAFTGLSVAQDIYTAGYYTNSDGQTAAVYKNGAQYGVCYAGPSLPMSSTAVVVHNGDVYWTANECDSDGTYKRAKILKNVNSTYMAMDNNLGRHINDLYSDGTNLWAVGCEQSSTALHSVAKIWKNGQYFSAPGTASYYSEALCVTGTTDGFLYVGGIQYTSATSYRGKIWSELTRTEYDITFPVNSEVRAIDILDFNGSTYTCDDIISLVYTKVSEDRYDVAVYLNNEVLYTLGTNLYMPESKGRDCALYVEDGNIYASCSYYSYYDYAKIWLNGVEIYSRQAGLTGFGAMVVNTKGKYFVENTGYNQHRASIQFKPGNNNVETLYTLNNCDQIVDMYIDDPECENTNIRTLPFIDDFEEGSTSWPCWTVIDVDNNNQYMSFWNRGGQHYLGYLNPASGDYCAWHQCWNSSQEGWLITPRLFLQPGQSSTTLTFKSFQGTCGSVWISTSGTNTSNFTQIWTDSNPGETWKTVTIDLSAYQGNAVYLAFKYRHNVYYHNWLIDDVSVTESFTPCSAASVPYTYDFSDGFGTCWTARDIDMSNAARNWQFDSDLQCMRHLYGPTGQGQDGWLFSKRVTLPSGNHNYTLSYKTKLANAQQGGETHTVWIAVDKTGAYDPSDYTQIYVDTSPGAGGAWTTNEVDLTSYKGHTISIAFRYYAPNGGGQIWYVDDFSITEPAPTQYTITVNANNNAWGTVSGGGQYNAGATCTLHATPASGYQFDSWKKNGSVVSTNPNYSFTVTENATYTAYFSAEPVTYYTITTNVTPTGAGTVTGGGTYPAGSSITLTATANPGYTFSQWQDGSTANPRTITVNGDATYTAQFTQDIYTISVYANPANGGTVTGGGAYHYGETPTLTATANSGYEFQGWNDGVSTNPRQITVTGNATYTAIFSEVGATYYVVTTSVSPAGAGTVTGGGAYEAGTVITLAATANPGYTFSQWNDGITQNPRTVTVNSNLSFTAVFTQNIYTITVLANPSNAGTVTGGGAYHYGEIVTLTATAYSGYEFQGWSDGSSQNPHQVTVTGNATYTATFSQSGTTYYTVSTYVSPIGAGTVTGAGTYPAGATATLSATANQGYTFSRWNDGSTSNPRTVTVNNNMSFTAIFTAQQYTITVNANPSNGGTVTGGGTYAYGSTATLRAIPNSGFEFMQWQDGSTQNPRVITVTGNATYTALFNTQGGTVYTLTVTPNYQLLGQTFGSGTYPAGSTVEIAAYPSEYAVFVQWNDGNTQNPRTVVVNSNVEYIAEFRAANRYTINVESANPNMGEAYGGGTFFEGAVTEISAIPNSGYVFTGWNDGNTQNPRTITVTGDATYTANFSENSVVTHTLTVICNTDQGTVSGGGIYMHGATAVIQAFPNQGYVFTKWSDENTENPRVVTMTNDLTLVAFFATGVGENEEPVLMVYPNPTKESIRILGIEANSSVEIYNSLGELVKVVSASEDQEINVRDLASGLYLLRCGNATLRFIKEQ